VLNITAGGLKPSCEKFVTSSRFLLKIALPAGVFMGSVHMAGGMLVHELSVMSVILNGMRLRWA
jgi:cation transport ATPase